MWQYKDHGKSYEAVYEREHPPGFRWVHESFGTNWRMLELQAVIGRIQLRRMNDWTSARTRHAQALWKAASPHAAVRVPAFVEQDAAGSVHAHYKCYVYVQPEKLAAGWSRDRITEAIQAYGVPCYQGSCSEVYLERAFDGTGWRPTERLPVARTLGETSLMFLVHPTLTLAEMDKSCQVIGQVLAKASA
ncbi:DegT/DnrJ/EryC1/StrS aminotransferase family protein [compost metagenome]